MNPLIIILNVFLSIILPIHKNIPSGIYILHIENCSTDRFHIYLIKEFLLYIGSAGLIFYPLFELVFMLKKMILVLT